MTPTDSARSLVPKRRTFKNGADERIESLGCSQQDTDLDELQQIPKIVDGLTGQDLLTAKAVGPGRGIGSQQR